MSAKFGVEFGAGFGAGFGAAIAIWVGIQFIPPNPHEDQAEQNVKQFGQELSQKPGDLSNRIELYNKYEDYIIKSRQSNHSWIQAYGQFATATASTVIAALLAALTLRGDFKPWPQSKADVVIKLIAASNKEHVRTNLKLFEKAGLIKLDANAIEELGTVDWSTRVQAEAQANATAMAQTGAEALRKQQEAAGSPRQVSEI